MAIIVDTKNVQYLVMYDKSPFGIFGNQEDAINAINSIADHEEASLKGPKVDVFRRSLHDGKEIHVLTKSKGILYDGSLVTTLSLEVTPISRLHAESLYAD